MQESKTFDELAALDRGLLEQRARDFVRMRDSGEIDGVQRMMAAAVVFRPCLPPRAPRGRVDCEGHVAVRAMLLRRHREYESDRSEIRLVVAEKGCVVVHRTTHLRHRGTSASGTFDAIDLIRFRDGLIVELAEFTDTAAVERLSADQAAP